MASRLDILPSLDAVQKAVSSSSNSPNPPNLIPLVAPISADILTPTSIYLKLTAKSQSKLSFLFESAGTTGTIGRYSFVGTGPRKVIQTGPGFGEETDPLPILQQELSKFRVAQIPGLRLPPLIGGGIGYVGYDCVKYFEPKTKRDMSDPLKIPESFFMLFDTVVAVDHFFQLVQVITFLRVPEDGNLERAYEEGSKVLREMVSILRSEETPLPPQGPIVPNQEAVSNIGQSGYENHVKVLRKHIMKGDIIQCVPSQRYARPTSLHPFNIYRELRTVNPSPYLFFVDCQDFQLVGASPEVLVKSEQGRIVTHPIAGTVKRGLSLEEDDELAEQLRNSLKDRAEHVMLVDLARNDVNRVADPLSTKVDRLMIVQRFSHVQHLTSEVSGVLRQGKTRFDAFRSIFPAGTTSGAPKVRAMELIAELEGEKRGVYAGAVGYFGYDSVAENGQVSEGAMDTCIALRTMLVKGGIAYLQAGGGIVFDSDPYEEYVETINKLGASMQTIARAEKKHLEAQAQQKETKAGAEPAVAPMTSIGEQGRDDAGLVNGEPPRRTNAHVDLAA
ncbi:anthranilate synthase component [Rhizodiscina lignyota]|uniref:Anthranilate synthase component n=1 Tax=Rhizodiscina lignyota TaxID=1504668 RepID=A0A9P4M6X0_9PEZI|nr:anthranilate synthase component [Rhizodiscina lignyota]